jgi:hypothetical protein
MQYFLGSVNYDFSACFPYILDFVKANFGGAWADTVDAFYACSNKRR